MKHVPNPNPLRPEPRCTRPRPRRQLKHPSSCIGRAKKAKERSASCFRGKIRHASRTKPLGKRVVKCQALGSGHDCTTKCRNSSAARTRKTSAALFSQSRCSTITWHTFDTVPSCTFWGVIPCISQSYFSICRTAWSVFLGCSWTALGLSARVAPGI